MTTAIETGYAKINLTLRVLGRRPDGYHEIESVVVFAHIGDTLTVSVSAGPRSHLEARGPFGGAITGENLITTAIARVEAACGQPLAVRVVLDKQLPVASGIGGGSADAAACLRAIRRLYPDHASTVDWHAITQSLGADVPVCLESRSALMTGTGERIAALALPALPLLLVNPQTPVPADKTRHIFARLAAPPLDIAAERLDVNRVPDTIDGLVRFAKATGNDLEAPAASAFEMVTEMKTLVAACTGCLHTALSGAGPTVFGVFETMEKALAAERAVTAARPHWWVRATSTL